MNKITVFLDEGAYHAVFGPQIIVKRGLGTTGADGHATSAFARSVVRATDANMQVR
ncbi:hypothetical protein [Mycobacteroides franklinii]|uniref:hypothetical protein n=1 Tax=Mycobacteroides franklinii TaxID=948102 RepID=UPI000A8E39A6|nr:hypothetical protein [Mycobacteroides franklinii]